MAPRIWLSFAIPLGLASSAAMGATRAIESAPHTLLSMSVVPRTWDCEREPHSCGLNWPPS